MAGSVVKTACSELLLLLLLPLLLLLLLLPELVLSTSKLTAGIIGCDVGTYDFIIASTAGESSKSADVTTFASLNFCVVDSSPASSSVSSRGRFGDDVHHTGSSQSAILSSPLGIIVTNKKTNKL